MSKGHRGHFEGVYCICQRYVPNTRQTPLNGSGESCSCFRCCTDETDRPVLPDNKMEAPAGSGDAQRWLQMPGVYPVWKTKSSHPGPSRSTEEEFPGITMVSVEPDRSMSVLSRKNALAILGRPVTDRGCAGTENAAKGRKR